MKDFRHLLHSIKQLKTLFLRKRQVTYRHVVWAYRLLLEREPESFIEVLRRVNAYSTIKELRTELLTSPEFRLKNPAEIPYATEQNIVIKELEDGLRLFVDLSDIAIGLNIVRGGFERSELAFIQRTIQPGQIVLDLGTNIGFFTMHMAALVGPSGKVYGFEPLSRNADLAERSVVENDFASRVTLNRVAVGDVPGKAHLLFEVKTLQSGGSYLVEEKTTTLLGHDVQEVDIVPLDQYKLQRPVAFIKMDIEGAEPLACRGAENILHQDRPIILAELNPDLYPRVAKCTPTDFVSEMARRGYDCYLLENGKPGKRIVQVSELCSGIFWPREKEI
jgi:FkbM family methyltransferase